MRQRKFRIETGDEVWTEQGADCRQAVIAAFRKKRPTSPGQFVYVKEQERGGGDELFLDTNEILRQLQPTSSS